MRPFSGGLHQQAVMVHQEPDRERHDDQMEIHAGYPTLSARRAASSAFPVAIIARMPSDTTPVDGVT